jgi:hypothetical protein
MFSSPSSSIWIGRHGRNEMGATIAAPAHRN